ncbi:Uncharacterised protein [Pseudomonas aeruginosa]|nr:Uncharacterised protein [Pseudomonas aeruginosa]
MRREFGPESEECRYAEQLRDYCLEHGVVRFEQELKSEFLARLNLRYWAFSMNAGLSRCMTNSWPWIPA